MPPDHTNPLAVFLPHHFASPNDYPTEVLASRFQAWRLIIRDLVTYLKEYSSVQEEIVRQQLRLQQAVGAPSSGTSGQKSSSGHHGLASGTSRKDEVAAINRFFLPVGNGSVQDLPTILSKFHQQNVASASKSLKDLNTIIIPKLEELRRDLLVKIKEIKNLENDFKTSIGKEIAETRTLLAYYALAVDTASKLEHSSSSSSIGPLGHHSESDLFKNDPFLVKIRLEKQLKRQIAEETDLYKAYRNLQTSGGKLESIVVLEIQNYLSMFLTQLKNEHATIPEYLLPHLNNGFLAKEPNFEWDSFISRNLPSPSFSVSAVGNNSSTVKNGTFVDMSFPPRTVADLSIPDFDSPLNLAVREGELQRRSKYLKSYSSGWYVLTCNFIHEFKTDNRKKDQTPVMSLLLDNCTVNEHSKENDKSGQFKFQLYSKQSSGLINRGHNSVFRTDTYKNMMDWYNDIKSLTSLPTPAARARFISKKTKFASASGTNSKKISRASSLLSTGTANKSLKTVSTVNQSVNSARFLNPKGTEQPGSRPLSQTFTTSSANYRLSSTFSQKNNNQSPKLNNLINSDGTIITPVESFRENHRSSDNLVPATPQHSQQGHPHQQQYIITPQQVPQQAIPVQANSSPQYLSNPQQNPQQNYPFYISSPNPQANQLPGPAQFYDPIQQQFFTIAPQSQGPQPQYFPSSPQQAQPSQFVPVAAQGAVPEGQQPVYPINTASYFTLAYAPQFGAESGHQAPYPVSTFQLGSALSSRNPSLVHGHANGVLKATNTEANGAPAAEVLVSGTNDDTVVNTNDSAVAQLLDNDVDTLDSNQHTEVEDKLAKTSLGDEH